MSGTQDVSVQEPRSCCILPGSSSALPVIAIVRLIPNPLRLMESRIRRARKPDKLKGSIPQGDCARPMLKPGLDAVGGLSPG